MLHYKGESNLIDIMTVKYVLLSRFVVRSSILLTASTIEQVVRVNEIACHFLKAAQQ